MPGIHCFKTVTSHILLFVFFWSFQGAGKSGLYYILALNRIFYIHMYIHIRAVLLLQLLPLLLPPLLLLLLRRLLLLVQIWPT